MSERLWPLHQNSLLSIAAGVISTSDPTAISTKLRTAADEQQKRAKQRSKESTLRPSVIAVTGKEELVVIPHGFIPFPAIIRGSYFQNIKREKGIAFTVTNTGRDPLPPFKVALFHPKLGTFSIFPSEKEGSLLTDQERTFSCAILENDRVPQWFPQLSHDISGQQLAPSDDAGFEFQLVLEDSDHKVLYRNRRIGRGLATLIRRAIADGKKIGGTGNDWRELSNELPDE
jgi:hypothetical protein